MASEQKIYKLTHWNVCCQNTITRDQHYQPTRAPAHHPYQQAWVVTTSSEHSKLMSGLVLMRGLGVRKNIPVSDAKLMVGLRVGCIALTYHQNDCRPRWVSRVTHECDNSNPYTRSGISVIRRSSFPQRARFGPTTNWSQPETDARSKAATPWRFVIAESNHCWWWPLISPTNRKRHTHPQPARQPFTFEK